MKTDRLRFRSRILPRSLYDWGMFVSTVVLIPTVYIYEMSIVLPFISNEYAILYYVISVLGLFVFVNIAANFVGLVVTDTSVPKEVMSTERVSNLWKYCSDCLSYVPPRAWHCKLCRVCILKRDHHCAFSSYCVGHFNHRFFIMFLIYLNIGTLYCVISESFFIFSKVNFLVISSIIKLTLPICAVVLGLETFQNEMYIVMYIVVWAAFVFTCMLLRFHLRIILKGQVTHDVSSQNFMFDFGYIENIKMVLGDRWFIAWTFPLIHSSLPVDGINWQAVASWKQECHRNLMKER